MISTAPAGETEDMILTAPAGEQSGDSSQAPVTASKRGATASTSDEYTPDSAAEQEGDLANPPSPSASASLAADLQGLAIDEQRWGAPSSRHLLCLRPFSDAVAA